MSCYCSERNNPKMREFFKDIPNGYCGFCDVCGETGHTMAHPRLPTTGAWCDRHYNDLISYRIFTLADIFFVVLLLLLVTTIGVLFYG